MRVSRKGRAGGSAAADGVILLARSRLQGWAPSRAAKRGRMSIFDLKGRRALVTGGAKGIGAAIVRALGEAGVRVAIADLDVAAAKDARGGDRRRRARHRDRRPPSRLRGEGAEGGDRQARRPRHPRRQCRRLHHAAARRPDRRRLGLQHGRERARRVPGEPDRLPAFPRGRNEGRHRQHRVARRQGRRAASRALFGVEVRRARLDAGARARDGAARHPRERRLSGLRARPRCRSARSSGRASSAA